MVEDVSLARFAHPRHWPTWFGVALLRLLGWLPLPVLALIGSGVGMLLYALHAPRRRVVRINFTRCFPELSPAQVGRLTRQHFRAFGQTLFDVAIAWWSTRRRMRRIVRFRDQHHYDEARRAGRNVILLAPHFVGLELAGIRLSLEGPLLTVFRHPVNELVRALMYRARVRFGLKLLEHNQSFTSLVRAVKSGVPLYYLPDQDAGRRHSVFAPFFGIPAATFTALGRLARMTNAVVIPCIAYQRKWGMGYDIVFRPALPDFPSDDPMTDATRMNAEIEAAVRVHPEQYFWVHKRFKTRPEGEPKFY